MSNYEMMDHGDQADRFYAMDVRPACDVCEDDADYALDEFGEDGCPDCGAGAPESFVPEDALMEFGLFGDC